MERRGWAPSAFRVSFFDITYKLRMINRKFKSCFSISAIFFIIIGGCGGRAAHPIMISQVGDKEKSCESLKVEMSQQQQQMSRLMPKTKKAVGNTLLGGFGVIFPFVWLAMDFNDSEQVEFNAHCQRYKHLSSIAAGKKCEFGSTQTCSEME